jgi:glucose-6-phosphate dehydrogenase assembly protein OpcA
MTTPTTIPLTQIKAALANQWHEVTRSSVLTLVAFATGADHADQVDAILDTLASQHPSRAITVAVEPAAERPTPAATVDLRTYALGATNTLIGSEQIVVYLPDTEVARVTDYVRPLLLSDMPVFVWLTGAPPQNIRLLDDLAGLGDHIVFDSAAFTDPTRDLAVLAGIIRRSRATAVNYKAFHDFNWERLAPWRAALAQAFDPPYLTHLAHVTQVRLGFAYTFDPSIIPQPTQAYLLAGWLASRLDWQPVTYQARPGSTVGRFQSPHQTAPGEIEIAPYTAPHVRIAETIAAKAPSQPTVLQGALLFVDFITVVNNQQILFRTALADDAARLVTTITRLDGEHAPPRSMPIEAQSAAELLAGQLTRFRYDHVYEDAVLAAQALITAGQG